MKFSYTKNRLYRNLLLGVFWIMIALVYLFTDIQMERAGYATFVLGICYITLYIYQNFSSYIEVTQDKIKIFSIPNKEIIINDIIEAKYYADDFTFRTKSKNFKILKSQINKSQLPEFELFFNKIKHEINKDNN